MITNIRKYLLSFLAGMVIMAVMCFGISMCSNTQTSTPDNTIVKIDTLRIRDTIKIDHPVYKTIKVLDTLLIPATDTVVFHDTSYVVIERVSKIYSDENYSLQISGYKPNLDWIKIHPKTTTVVITQQVPYNVVKQTPWGIGITVGYGATLYNNRQVLLSPYIGLGISYNFIRW